MGKIILIKSIAPKIAETPTFPPIDGFIKILNQKIGPYQSDEIIIENKNTFTNPLTRLFQFFKDKIIEKTKTLGKTDVLIKSIKVKTITDNTCFFLYKSNKKNGIKLLAKKSVKSETATPYIYCHGDKSIKINTRNHKLIFFSLKKDRKKVAQPIDETKIKIGIKYIKLLISRSFLNKIGTIGPIKYLKGTSPKYQ